MEDAASIKVRKIALLRPALMKLARENGVNANLVWKWIRKHIQSHPLSPSSTSAFIPVQIAAACSKFDNE
ncbi:hypothetical protein ACC754_36325 [Rhizobium johnstonii]|uniref:hypothetical protein n=1 Tax=Rhizobium johnstonii TaxID=3019933 RepID=UPI003F9889D3